MNVFPIEIPPLRDRREDIPLLVNYFVKKLSERLRKVITAVPEHVMDILANQTWQGNIRELANFLERAVILTGGDELELPACELRTSSQITVTSTSNSVFHQAESQVKKKCSN